MPRIIVNKPNRRSSACSISMYGKPGARPQPFRPLDKIGHKNFQQILPDLLPVFLAQIHFQPCDLPSASRSRSTLSVGVSLTHLAHPPTDSNLAELRLIVPSYVSQPTSTNKHIYSGPSERRRVPVPVLTPITHWYTNGPLPTPAPHALLTLMGVDLRYVHVKQSVEQSHRFPDRGLRPAPRCDRSSRGASRLGLAFKPPPPTTAWWASMVCQPPWRGGPTFID